MPPIKYNKIIELHGDDLHKELSEEEILNADLIYHPLGNGLNFILRNRWGNMPYMSDTVLNKLKGHITKKPLWKKLFHVE